MDSKVCDLVSVQPAQPGSQDLAAMPESRELRVLSITPGVQAAAKGTNQSWCPFEGPSSIHKMPTSETSGREASRKMGSLINLYANFGNINGR